jgi:hypothetical protein
MRVPVRLMFTNLRPEVRAAYRNLRGMGLSRDDVQVKLARFLLGRPDYGSVEIVTLGCSWSRPLPDSLVKLA